MKELINRINSPALLLRVGLAFVFLYAAIDSLIHPDSWVAFLPKLLTDQFDAMLLLKFFSVYEVLLGAALLSGIFVRYVALLTAATLAGITAASYQYFIVSFRDVGLVLAALALAALPENKK